MKTMTLKIILWGMEIGRLKWDDRHGYSIFEYSRDFLDKGLDIAPLTHSIRTISARRPVIFRDRASNNLPPFIADSLPDAWGNLVFEEWAARNSLRSHEVTVLEKLAYIGKRGMGALEFAPDKGIKDTDEELKINNLAELAEQIFRERDNMSVVAEKSLTLQALFKIGMSVGGRQAKAVIAYNPETREIRSGQTCLHPSFTHAILKFDLKTQYDHPATALEMVYYRMALDAGLDMMRSYLTDIEGKRHFVTERFDRNKGEKIFSQTLGAINPDADSYESLVRTARTLGTDRTDIIRIFRQAAFNFLGGNTDDHKGNFTFLMDKTGHWRLSPAYDITFTWRNPNESFLHCLSLRGKTKDVSIKDLLEFAKDEGIPSATKIIEEVMDGICNFRTYCNMYGIPQFWTNFIEECLYELAPDSRKDALSGWKADKIEEYCEGAYRIEAPHLNLAESGNIHLEAKIDGTHRKYIIRKKTELAKTLLIDNAISCNKDTLKELVRKHLLHQQN